MDIRRKKAVLKVNGLQASKKFNIKALWLIALEKLIKFIQLAWSKIKKVSKEYFENSSINCYQYMADDTMESWERWLWRAVHASATGVAIWLIWLAGNTAILAPVATTRAPSDVPLITVPHPAVAVCPYNKISAIKATKFAQELILNKSFSRSVEEVVTLLSYLGLAYDMETSEGNELDSLHYLLEPYDLEDLLRDLAPNCSDVINRCRWRNNPVDCSTIFVFRRTTHGFCCLFNYQEDGGILSNLSSNGNEKLKAISGQERGLSLLVDPQVDDYLYSSIPNAGFMVMVFNPEDYPDMPSGACYQVPVPPQTEVYAQIDVISITSNEAVEKLSVSSRQCMFDSDRRISDFKDSFSDCMVNCRMSNIRTTCDCVPFFLPSLPTDNICDLQSMTCLKRWKEKWNLAWSGEDLLLENGEIAGNPRQPPCFSCLPQCEEAIYRPHQYTISLQPDSLNSQPDENKIGIKKGIHFDNHSVIHVYFSKDSVVHLELGLLSNWWDLLSSLGGLCGLVLGASVISVAEIIYYCLGGPATKFRRRQQEMRQLYWEELRNYKRK